MTQTIRELLTELAWIEDSIRHVPLDGEGLGVNPDLLALASRELEIIAELRTSPSSPSGLSDA